MAHSILAQMEVDTGHARQAMVRLLRQARQVPGDPELYAALCHVCRYCGLLGASAAAHAQAIRLAPKISTSVIHTWFVLRKYDRVVEGSLEGAPHNGALSLHALGRTEEALALIQAKLAKVPPVMRLFVQAAQFVIEGNAADLSGLRALLEEFNDPEGLYYLARCLAKLGDTDGAVLGMTRSIERGYSCYPTFATDPWLDVLRGRPEFDAALERARADYEAAIEEFRNADGERIIGVTLPSR
jgi:predicted Zn-dependent protease